MTLYTAYFFSFCDVSEDWQFGIQDPATPNAEGMIYMHNYLNLFSIFIAFTVFYLLYKIITDFNSISNLVAFKFSHSSLLEIIWTVIPAIILLLIAVPSFALLYSLDELIDPSLTLKIIGNQWYWTYEYSDITTYIDSLRFESHMRTMEDMFVNHKNEGYGFRLLEVADDAARDVPTRVILPIHTHIRLLVTAADVLHSWAVPSFGIKVDACPGRLSQASLFIKREGVYYGQCSEICGIGHGFMPIVVEGVSLTKYIGWIFYQLEKQNT